MQRDSPRFLPLPAEAGATSDAHCVYRLQAGSIALEFMTLGATITRLETPDRDGQRSNIVLGPARLPDYGATRDYFGAVVGRLANRLRAGELPLDGKLYRLSCNDGRHHLHGGVAGFDRKVWCLVETSENDYSASARLEYVSHDGEEGYPGTVRAAVRYSVTVDGSVEILFAAQADQPTVVNLTNHSYFNLSGEGEADVLRHELMIAADRFCVIDDELIPTGELRAVAGTALEFRSLKPVGQDIGSAEKQMQVAGGYDHCMVLSQLPPVGELGLACLLFESSRGRRLEVWTDQPAVQFYSGNFLDGTVTGRNGRAYGRHAGLCLETQKLPDAPHHPGFPAVTLNPGESYVATTRWRFSTG
jgi:aldose 1-epimerase